MIYNRAKGFTLIELLVSITIIGILITIVTVAVLPIQKKSRDSRRKADLNLLISGLSLFNSDYKVYPNPTFYLGSFNNSNKAKNSNYGLAADIVSCNGAQTGATATFMDLNGNTIAQPGSPTINELDTKGIKLAPGFIAVNNFLACLKYMDRLVQDPLFVGNDRYQYRISYDYSEFLVGAKLENQNDQSGKTSLFSGGATYLSKWFFDGNGVNARNLDDDTDVSSSEFYTLVNGKQEDDGSYFYQCTKTGENIDIDEDKRPDFAPLINNGSGWLANKGTTPTTCLDGVDANTVSRSSY